MANTIQFKRNSSGVPGNSGHAAGEPLYNTGDSRLWIASDASTPNWVGAPILDEDNMASNSALKLATQQSIISGDWSIFFRTMMLFLSLLIQ